MVLEIKVKKNVGPKKRWNLKNFESNKFWAQIFWAKWSSSKNPDMYKCHQDNCWLDKCQLDSWICSRCSQEPTIKVSSKSGQQQLRYCWHWVSVAWVVGGWCAKSFSGQTQLCVEVWLGIWQYKKEDIFNPKITWNAVSSFMFQQKLAWGGFCLLQY